MEEDLLNYTLPEKVELSADFIDKLANVISYPDKVNIYYALGFLKGRLISELEQYCDNKEE